MTEPTEDERKQASDILWEREEGWDSRVKWEQAHWGSIGKVALGLAANRARAEAEEHLAALDMRVFDLGNNYGVPCNKEARIAFAPIVAERDALREALRELVALIHGFPERALPEGLQAAEDLLRGTP